VYQTLTESEQEIVRQRWRFWWRGRVLSPLRVTGTVSPGQRLRLAFGVEALAFGASAQVGEFRFAVPPLARWSK